VLKLYHAPLTRSVRIYWLLEELGVPYRLEQVEFRPPEKVFSQATPRGKLPTLEDGDVTLFESGAILEYVLERYGEGRLAPPPGSPERALFLQWVHFAEGTAFVGLGNMAWHAMFKKDAESLPEAMADYRGWAIGSLEVLERALEGRPYLLGEELSGADIMVGYTVQTARWFGLLAEGFPNLSAYMDRLVSRPALQRALAT
jgi:glutathione S-transferase